MQSFAALCAVWLCGATLPAQTALPSGTPISWVTAAVDHETHIIDEDGSFPLRLRQHKVDDRGDTVREMIETRQGAVARLVERNGQPITLAEDEAEKQRLNAILLSPDDFIKHHKRDDSTRSYSTQLVRQMPSSMLYSYTPGQPQPPNGTGVQIVIDFKPDPNFKPPTMISQLLTGIEGRMWVDAKSQRLTRVEGHIIKSVNFGWGMLAQIKPGGTVTFEQTDAGGGHWVYSQLDEHITVRAMMVKTIAENLRMVSGDFRPLPTPLSFQDAVRTLLAMQIPLR